MGKNRIRLTESQLYRIIRECVNETIENESAMNWARAGVDGLTNMSDYAQGPTNSRLRNWYSNVKQAKQHYDDQDTIQKGNDYNCSGAPEVQRAQARSRMYREPGRAPVSDITRSRCIGQIIQANDTEQRINALRRRRKYGY